MQKNLSFVTFVSHNISRMGQQSVCKLQTESAMRNITHSWEARHYDQAPKCNCIFVQKFDKLCNDWEDHEDWKKTITL